MTKECHSFDKRLLFILKHQQRTTKNINIFKSTTKEHCYFKKNDCPTLLLPFVSFYFKINFQKKHITLAAICGVAGPFQSYVLKKGGKIYNIFSLLLISFKIKNSLF